MKVFMIAPQPFFEPRGTPISVYQRLQALSALEYDVDLLTYHVGKDIDIPGVRIHRIPNVPFVREIGIGPSWTKILLDILLFFKAVIMLATNRYDVIHSHEEAAFFSPILATTFRRCHLYDMHSNLPGQLRNSRYGNCWPAVKLFEVLENLVINTCDAVITIGADLEERVRKINPKVKQIRLENLPVHANGKVDSQGASDEVKDRLGLDNRPTIVYTGTFEHYQGLDLLIDSARIVRQNSPNVAFILVGGKPQQIEHWQNEARQKRLENCVFFVGTVPLEEAMTYLDVADILVSPRTEGLSVPLKIYSYLHSGKPIVATKLLAHTQILNEEIAVLTPPEKESFAGGILRLIQYPNLRRQLGLRAQQFAKENYSPENYLAKLEQVYQAFQPTSHTSHEPDLSLGKLVER